MPPMMAKASGRCKSDPIPPVKRKGVNANMVVILVMSMGLSLRLPATDKARNNEYPSFCNCFMVSTFKIESLIMIPLITTMPIKDMRLMLLPNIHKNNKAPNISMGTSSNTIMGRVSDSNCAAKMKNNRLNDINRIIISCPTISRLLK